MKHNPVERRLKNYSLLAPEIGCLEKEVQTAKEMLETLNNFKITLEDDVRAKVDERLRKLNEQIEHLKTEKALIESVIEEIEDPAVRRIFELKHYSLMVWSDIATKVGYSERQCRRLYKDTIEKIVFEK